MPDGRFWEKFCASPEYAEYASVNVAALDDPASNAHKNPMDHYSKRIIDAIAMRFDLAAHYPFGGPPFSPFIEWALASEDIHHSPIGLFVHDRFGLWVSFRGALEGRGIGRVGEGGAPSPNTRKMASPCNNCAAPCTTSCPVNAFSSGVYDVEACRQHLKSGEVDCRNGCLARRVCPAASIQRDEAQSRFHMRAFCDWDE